MGILLARSQRITLESRAGREHACAGAVCDVEGTQSVVVFPPARAYLSTALGAGSNIGVRPKSFHCRRFDSQAMESLHFHKAALAAERRVRMRLLLPLLLFGSLS
jgi:hypothetical protein